MDILNKEMKLFGTLSKPEQAEIYKAWNIAGARLDVVGSYDNTLQWKPSSRITYDGRPLHADHVYRVILPETIVPKVIKYTVYKYEGNCESLENYLLFKDNNGKEHYLNTAQNIIYFSHYEYENGSILSTPRRLCINSGDAPALIPKYVVFIMPTVVTKKFEKIVFHGGCLRCNEQERRGIDDCK